MKDNVVSVNTGRIILKTTVGTMAAVVGRLGRRKGAVCMVIHGRAISGTVLSGRATSLGSSSVVLNTDTRISSAIILILRMKLTRVSLVKGESRRSHGRDKYSVGILMMLLLLLLLLLLLSRGRIGWSGYGITSVMSCSRNTARNTGATSNARSLSRNNRIEDRVQDQCRSGRGQNHTARIRKSRSISHTRLIVRRKSPVTKASVNRRKMRVVGLDALKSHGLASPHLRRRVRQGWKTCIRKRGRLSGRASRGSLTRRRHANTRGLLSSGTPTRRMSMHT